MDRWKRNSLQLLDNRASVVFGRFLSLVNGNNNDPVIEDSFNDPWKLSDSFVSAAPTRKKRQGFNTRRGQENRPMSYNGPLLFQERPSKNKIETKEKEKSRYRKCLLLRFHEVHRSLLWFINVRSGNRLKKLFDFLGSYRLVRVLDLITSNAQSFGFFKCQTFL